MSDDIVLNFCLAAAGAVSSLHANLGNVEDSGDADDKRDIDSARVYLEAVHWKLTEVIERRGDEPEDDTLAALKAAEQELHQRELHHFETEQMLARVKELVDAAEYSTSQSLSRDFTGKPFEMPVALASLRKALGLTDE